MLNRHETTQKARGLSDSDREESKAITLKIRKA